MQSSPEKSDGPQGARDDRSNFKLGNKFVSRSKEGQKFIRSSFAVNSKVADGQVLPKIRRSDSNETNNQNPVNIESARNRKNIAEDKAPPSIVNPIHCIIDKNNQVIAIGSES